MSCSLPYTRCNQERIYAKEQLQNTAFCRNEQILALVFGFSWHNRANRRLNTGQIVCIKGSAYNNRVLLFVCIEEFMGNKNDISF